MIQQAHVSTQNTAKYLQNRRHLQGGPSKTGSQMNLQKNATIADSINSKSNLVKNVAPKDDSLSPETRGINLNESSQERLPQTNALQSTDKRSIAISRVNH